MIKKLIPKNNIFNSAPSQSIASAAFIITLAGLISRVLGLVRDRFLASTFGAGDVLDIYYAAFRIPDLIYNLLIMGALSAAFIPVFTSLVSKEKEKDAWRLASGILNLAIAAIIIFSLVFCFFAESITNLITPGFSDEKLAQVVTFTRIMFLSPLFLGISGIFGGVLTSFKRFLVYSLAPIFYNVGIIIGILFFVKFMGPVGLAWGVVLGAFLHMSIQYPAARHLGYKHQWKMLQLFKNEDIRKVGKLMIPRTLGIAVNQINLFVITIFASTLAAGSLAVLTLAQNIQGVPLGIFGISFAIAVFPSLSAYFAKNDQENFVKYFSETLRQILFFVVPLSIFIIILRAQIVRVILGAGQFDWEDTILTFECLGIFAMSLFAQSSIPLLARAYYAMHDTKTPFYIALFTELVNIILVISLIGRFGVVGLAYAFSVTSLVQMFLLLFILRTRFENLDDKRIVKSLTKIALASFLAGIVVQVFKYITARYVDMDTFIGVFLQLSISALAGALVFITIVYLAKSEEFLYFKNSLTKRVFRAKKVIVEDTSDVSGM